MYYLILPMINIPAPPLKITKFPRPWINLGMDMEQPIHLQLLQGSLLGVQVRNPRHDGVPIHRTQVNNNTTTMKQQPQKQ